jgi:hypothetical protein
MLIDALERMTICLKDVILPAPPDGIKMALETADAARRAPSDHSWSHQRSDSNKRSNRLGATWGKPSSMKFLLHANSSKGNIGELYRISEPGARHLLTAPDALQEHLQERVAAPDYFQKTNHILIVESDEFIAMTERTGLIVENSAYYGFF